LNRYSLHFKLLVAENRFKNIDSATNNYISR